MEKTTIPTSKEHTSGDNIAAYNDLMILIRPWVCFVQLMT